MENLSSIHQREADFHDEWARSTDIRSISVREAFEAPTAMENRFLLARMGNLAGKRLLDVGAGLGESSVYFALLGAQVTTTDISPEMVETAPHLPMRIARAETVAPVNQPDPAAPVAR